MFLPDFSRTFSDRKPVALYSSLVHVPAPVLVLQVRQDFIVSDLRGVGSIEYAPSSTIRFQTSTINVSVVADPAAREAVIEVGAAFEVLMKTDCF